MVIHLKLDIYEINYNSNLGRLSLIPHKTADRILYFYEIDKIYTRNEGEHGWTRLYKKDITINDHRKVVRYKWCSRFYAEIAFSCKDDMVKTNMCGYNRNVLEDNVSYTMNIDIKDYIQQSELDSIIKKELSEVVNNE